MKKILLFCICLLSLISCSKDIVTLKNESLSEIINEYGLQIYYDSEDLKIQTEYYDTVKYDSLDDISNLENIHNKVVFLTNYDNKGISVEEVSVFKELYEGGAILMFYGFYETYENFLEKYYDAFMEIGFFQEYMKWIPDSSPESFENVVKDNIADAYTVIKRNDILSSTQRDGRKLGDINEYTVIGDLVYLLQKADMEGIL